MVRAMAQQKPCEFNHTLSPTHALITYRNVESATSLVNSNLPKVINADLC